MMRRNSSPQYDLVAQEEGIIVPLSSPGRRRGFFGLVSRSSRVIKITLVFTFALLIGISINFGQMITKPVSLPTSPSNHPLTVLISTTDAAIGEVDYWIHGILAHLGRPIDVQVVYPKNIRVVDDSIILAFNDLQKWTDVKVQSHFQNVGLLRIGDEYGNDTSYKHYSYVFRPYWFDHIYYAPKNDTPVLWIPNGYSTGVGPRPSSSLLSFSQRPHLCYFEGSPRDSDGVSSRDKMRLALEKWDPRQQVCQVRWTSGFMMGQTPLMYSASLGRAKYALCPAGNNGETIRFYEALENNAIPIVVYEPWMAGVFGADARFPFIVLNTWDELGVRFQALAAEDPSIGQVRQTATRNWWEETQNNLRDAAMRLVDDSFNRKYGDHGHMPLSVA